MYFKVSFNVDNAAYRLSNGDVATLSVADSVRQVANRLADDERSGIVRDANGNPVGGWGLFEEE